MTTGPSKTADVATSVMESKHGNNKRSNHNSKHSQANLENNVT